MVNNCTFSGYIGGKPITKNVKGYDVCEFTLAVSRGKDKDALWLFCSVWGKRAMTAQNYLNKGDKITVTGKIDITQYQDKTKILLNVNDFDLPVRLKQSKQPEPAQKVDMQSPIQNDFINDDVPF